MRAITTLGLDIAKSVFQVHGIDAEELIDYAMLHGGLHRLSSASHRKLI